MIGIFMVLTCIPEMNRWFLQKLLLEFEASHVELTLVQKALSCSTSAIGACSRIQPFNGTVLNMSDYNLCIKCRYGYLHLKICHVSVAIAMLRSIV